MEENLRQSFRVLAAGRPRADILELPGVSIASLGVIFQMFNAAYLSSPVNTEEELNARLETAAAHFRARGFPWSFWICEDWLSKALRRRMARVCQPFGLRLASEMPGMMAPALKPSARTLPDLDVRLVASDRTLADFQTIGSCCFHVPQDWFREVFNDFTSRSDFACFVGYLNGEAVATAATVPSGDVVGVYNVATLPDRRERGCGEAITRQALAAFFQEHGHRPAVLQSTWQGQSLYERMGFEAVARFSVFNSLS